MTKTTREPLLPDRYPTGDLFICDILDAAPKGDMASMEHPIFTLSTKPDTTVREYKRGDQYLKITPSVMGLATVHDRDVLIYCISQCMAALNEGRQVHRTLRFKAADLLASTNRQRGGTGYAGLKAALERLRGTSITTNITTGDVEVIDGFGLIDNFRIVRETREGRMQDVEITLSDWVFNAIRAKEVLTMSRDYFRLRKPLERRLYEIARKHCGDKGIWKIGIAKLKAKCGSLSTDKEFARLLRKVASEDAVHSHLPDYSLRLEDGFAVFRRRAPVVEHGTRLRHKVSEAAMETARSVLRPAGLDVHAMLDEWEYMASEKGEPENPHGAFINFCKRRVKGEDKRSVTQGELPI